MWLVLDLTPADIERPATGRRHCRPRIEADHLAEPLKIGALVVMQVREPDAQVSIGTLYILDDDSDVAIVRLQGESPDLLIVESVLRRWRFTAIKRDFEVLSSSNASQAQKLESLKFLGHWVGDIHQSLHVSIEDDGGGKSILVSRLGDGPEK